MSLIKSRNILGANGFTVGNIVNKDMSNTSCDPLDSASAPNNIGITSGEFTGSRWSDWGADVFDGWGWFYVFNPATNEYYLPLVNPQNEPDEVISTQTFTAFGKTFTMKQGYPAQGIFKFDISVNDPNFQFIFGSYGELGSDGDGISTNLTYNYSKNSKNFTLFYNKNEEDGDPVEILYSYFVPYQSSLNNTKTYDDFLVGSDSEFSIFSVPVKQGVTVYFAKTNDVKDWVVNDLGLFNVKSQKINQRSALNQSLKKRTVWKGYSYYQTLALKYGFVRITLKNYKNIYFNK